MMNYGAETCYNRTMSDTLLGSIIGAVVALIVCLITNWSARKNAAVAQAKRDQKIDDSIQELSKRVDAHNSLSDKIINMEKSIVRIETKLDAQK